MNDLASLTRAKALSQEILETAATDNLERLQQLEAERAALLPTPADFEALKRLPEAQRQQALTLVRDIIALNDAARTRLAPLHEDLGAYTRRLDTIKRHYEMDQPSFG